MISSMRLFLVVAMVTSVLSACTFNIGKDKDDASVEERKEVIPVGTVKPEIDFSSEIPSCEVAAQRIGDNLLVGMMAADVRRLVGKPRVIFPGIWLWTSSFSFEGRPAVRFGLSSSEVSSFSADSNEC